MKPSVRSFALTKGYPPGVKWSWDFRGGGYDPLIQPKRASLAWGPKGGEYADSKFRTTNGAGALITAGQVQLLGNSDNLGGPSWTPSNVTVTPPGTLTDNSNTQIGAVSQGTVITGGEAYSFLVDVARTSGAVRYPSVLLEYSGGTPKSNRLVIDTNTGQVAANDGFAGAIMQLNPADSNYWTVRGYAPSSAGNANVKFDLIPAYNLDGSATSNPAATGSAEFRRSTVVQGNAVYAPILGDKATTVSDNNTIENRGWLFSRWLTVFVEAVTPGFQEDSGPGQFCTLFTFMADLNDLFDLFRDGSDNSINARLRKGGVNEVFLSSIPTSNRQPIRVACAIDTIGHSLRMSVDGAKVVTGTGANSPDSINVAKIGVRADDQAQWNEHICKVAVWAQLLPDDTLQNLTSTVDRG